MCDVQAMGDLSLLSQRPCSVTLISDDDLGRHLSAPGECHHRLLDRGRSVQRADHHTDVDHEPRLRQTPSRCDSIPMLPFGRRRARGVRRVDFRFLLAAIPEAAVAWHASAIADAVKQLPSSGQPQPDAVFTRLGAGPLPRRLSNLPRVVESAPWRPPTNSQASRWWVVVSRDRPVAFVPFSDTHLLTEALQQWHPSRAVTRGFKTFLLAVPAAAKVLVPQVHVYGDDGVVTPALFAAAMSISPVDIDRGYLLTDGGSERRRVTALLYGTGSARAAIAAKLERHPGGALRAAAESAVAHRLAGIDHGSVAVPRQLAVGDVQGRALVLEEAAAGQPLSALLTSSPGRAASALDELVEWCGRLASSTTVINKAPRLPIESAERLWPEAAIVLRAASHRITPAGVPSVLGHGNLADGGNVLVDDGGQVSVIDWETAEPHSAPLADLLPLMLHGLAVLGSLPSGGTESRIELAVAMVTGESQLSSQLFSIVDKYLVRLRVNANTVGSLATCAVLQQGIVPLRHDEMLRNAGLPTPAWTSFFTRVGEAWIRHDQLGVDWPAFHRWKKSGVQPES
jgi:hypothetical protein